MYLWYENENALSNQLESIFSIFAYFSSRSALQAIQWIVLFCSAMKGPCSKRRSLWRGFSSGFRECAAHLHPGPPPSSSQCETEMNNGDRWRVWTICPQPWLQCRNNSKPHTENFQQQQKFAYDLMTSCYLAESNNRGVLINLWLITNVIMSEQYVYLVCISNKEKYSESNVYEFRESRCSLPKRPVSRLSRLRRHSHTLSATWQTFRYLKF